jgi:transcriptional regulator with XRE-family HTH domain
MIDCDLSVNDVAEGTGMTRSYVSTILNGRIYSKIAVKRISDYLGIPDSDGTTVLS